jgi:hypothetical protein
MADKQSPMNHPAQPGDPIDLASSVAGEEDPGASFDAPAPENPCPRCGGTGRIGASACPECAGTGRVAQAIGGA